MSKFEAGKTYPLRGGGTGEVLKVLDDGRLAVVTTDANGYVHVAPHLDNGQFLYTQQHHIDLMPPTEEPA